MAYKSYILTLGYTCTIYLNLYSIYPKCSEYHYKTELQTISLFYIFSEFSLFFF